MTLNKALGFYLLVSFIGMATAQADIWPPDIKQNKPRPAAEKKCAQWLSVISNISESWSKIETKIPTAKQAVLDFLSGTKVGMGSLGGINNALADQGFFVFEQSVDYKGLKSGGFAGSSHFFQFSRTYVNFETKQMVIVEGRGSFVDGTPRGAKIPVNPILSMAPVVGAISPVTPEVWTRVEEKLADDQKALADATKPKKAKKGKKEKEEKVSKKKGPPEAKSQKEMEARLTAIIEQAQIANGEVDLQEYDPAKFSLEKEMQWLEDRLANEIDDGETKPNQVYITKTGLKKTLKLIREEIVPGNEEDHVADELEKLGGEGLIKEVIFRTTKKYNKQTYYIPNYIQVFIEFQVNGVVKGYRMSLFYSTGD